ncbi:MULTISPECIES: low molecular weight phosphatase family protein [Brucella/Ochrobactrum group]|jgi:protein-tyrosine-phosphatase|uniref:Low molecular weight phosphatase family protein n=1 Tax=Brucella pseudintermedia TaxID=370111 RepID=A0ABY5U9E8_9HYPH|nr:MULTISPECIES: low molecular weight phosphatase family protein [Brucella/Ochrobactrum group]MCO7725306.1 low molecular weight phosphatase family protein [Brucella intermedia]TWH02022.1 protein-tyrosine-phosphatase [Ochrobactrum sp. J50]UWL59959.1 low molecular weight phosphatase family protein [Brucella pseudintermedia]WPM80379.1 low molecular weight phosphatase family protein [Brucella pseudintermedia]
MIVTDVPPVTLSETDREDHKRRLPTSLLFVCGKNAIRSPIAELLARKALPPNIYVASAGVKRGERDPFVDAVLQEEGLSLDNRQPRGLEELADGYFDLIVTLTPLAHHTVLERMRGFSVDVEYWPTPDPTLVTGSRSQIMAAYRDVRDRLKRQIMLRFGEQ